MNYMKSGVASLLILVTINILKISIWKYALKYAGNSHLNICSVLLASSAMIILFHTTSLNLLLDNLDVNTNSQLYY